MIEENRLKKIVACIEQYCFEEPLHFYLKTFFNQNRNMGSRDRKLLRSCVYNYFRMGKSLDGHSTEEKIAISSFLILKESNPLSEYCITNLTSLPIEKIKEDKVEKINLVTKTYSNFNIEQLFPFQKLLSSKIDINALNKSLLQQPKVWIRVRKNYFEKVIRELEASETVFIKVTDLPYSLGFENAVNLTVLESYEKGYFEIQDISSQRTYNLFQANAGEEWWDCCAGSGGKSLMLTDYCENIKLTVSDTRDSILKNLEARFRKLSVKNYKIKHFDLSVGNIETEFLKNTDGIIADVPCSGSGTWGRTPEMLSGFAERDIERITALQKKILATTSSVLKPGKKLIYITCSVFKNENEDIVAFAEDNLGFKTEEQKLFKGYNEGADTLFAARLIKQ